MRKLKTHVRPLSPLRRRVFLAITLSIPVVFLVCLELALRWLDYGPDLSLFVRRQIRGQTYYVMNPGVKFRYFGTSHFAPSTSPEYFQVPKPRGVYRIFCLGGSTTVGYPYWYNGSFSSYLRDRLRATFPQKNIEIMNLGMTATNSFTALDIARELAKYQPDLIIDYDGHNEFYGALGVASHQTMGSSRFVTLLYLRLIHFRTFQLLRDAIQGVAGLFGRTDNPDSRGTMMETLARDRYVPYGSAMYDAAYSMFRKNLEDLKATFRSVGIPLILGTQVSNLRDQPPFVSTNSPALPSEQRTLFQRLYKEGVDLQSKGVLDSAIVTFRSAIAVDSCYADAHYRLAQCLDAAGRKREALLEYVRARDYDELRFRMDSKFNDLVRAMDDHEHCFVSDIEGAFKALSPDSLIGYNLITEHLHPNSRGYYVIAEAYAQVMRQRKLLATLEEWSAADTLNEDRLWENRCVTDLDERIAARWTELLTSGWPFRAGSPTLEPAASTDTLGQIAERTIRGELDWRGAHDQAIAFYRRRGDLKSVEREYETVLKQMPLDLELYLDLARLYLQQKRFDAMERVLLQSLAVYPTIQACRTLGDLAMQKGDAAGSLKYYEKVDGFAQGPAERLQNGYILSLAYARAGELRKSKTRLLELLSAKPDFQLAIQLLIEVNKQLERKSTTRE